MGPGPGIIARVKHARPPLVQSGKPGTGGRSGLHRTAQEVTPLHREVRIRATETSRLSPGETGNLCAQQHQVGQPGVRPSLWFRRHGWRVGGTEPGGRPPAQMNGGHAGFREEAGAQNPAYRRASHFFLPRQLVCWWTRLWQGSAPASGVRPPASCWGTRNRPPAAPRSLL